MSGLLPGLIHYTPIYEKSKSISCRSGVCKPKHPAVFIGSFGLRSRIKKNAHWMWILLYFLRKNYSLKSKTYASFAKPLHSLANGATSPVG